MTDHAAIWHAALIRADTLDPAAAWRSANRTQQIIRAAPVLRAVSLDGQVSTSGHSDPTGRTIEGDQRSPDRAPAADIGALVRVEAAHRRFVDHANVVLDFVCGDTADEWHAVVQRARRLAPGTVQAGLDVDDEHALPPAILEVDRAVAKMASLCAELGCATRPPTPLEKGRTLKLPDSACCTLHLAAHNAYRVPRLPGKLLCQWCDALVHAADGRLPPPWLIDMMQTEDPAFVDGLAEWLAA
jgi:hypothetical protein